MNAALYIGTLIVFLTFLWLLRALWDRKLVLFIATVTGVTWTLIVAMTWLKFGEASARIEFSGNAKRELNYPLKKAYEQLETDGEKEQGMRKFKYLTENWEQLYLFEGEIRTDSPFIHWTEILEQFTLIDQEVEQDGVSN